MILTFVGSKFILTSGFKLARKKGVTDRPGNTLETLFKLRLNGVQIPFNTCLYFLLKLAQTA